MIDNFLYPVLENASETDTRSKSGASKSRPRWAEHSRIGNVGEYPPAPPPPRCQYSSLIYNKNIPNNVNNNNIKIINYTRLAYVAAGLFTQVSDRKLDADFDCL